MMQQPYQEASEEAKRRGETFGSYATNAAKIGAGTVATYGAAEVASRVMPFLSKYIPENLAIKGMSKVEPRLGKFIDTALKGGASFEGIKQFIGEKIESDPAIQDAKNDNPLWKFSSKLAKFVENALQTGHTLDEVVGMANSPGNNFQKEIKHVEKSIGMPFRDFLRSIYGGPKQPPQAQSAPPQAIQRQQPQVMQPQQGSGEAALLKTLEMINSRIPRK